MLQSRLPVWLLSYLQKLCKLLSYLQKLHRLLSYVQKLCWLLSCLQKLCRLLSCLQKLYKLLGYLQELHRLLMQLPAEVIGVCVTSHSSPHVLHQQIIATACQHDGYTEGLTVLHQQKEDPYVDKAAFCRQRNPKQMGKALPRTSFSRLIVM